MSNWSNIVAALRWVPALQTNKGNASIKLAFSYTILNKFVMPPWAKKIQCLLLRQLLFALTAAFGFCYLLNITSWSLYFTQIFFVLFKILSHCAIAFNSASLKILLLWKNGKLILNENKNMRHLQQRRYNPLPDTNRKR